MTTITIQAIYRDGVLQPGSKLDLPDNTPVQVQVTPLPTGKVSLFGVLQGIWKDVELNSIEVTLREIRASSMAKLEQLARELSTGPKNG
jgi:predicted DNA-binding antitoxin AbrB/MazE fold protein